ncbi:MAG: curved DNA-binding protein [Motiliproteus sp.]|jgi:curved DNA-binding protein
MEYKDYYKILGVERGANKMAIKRAYQKLARKYHPDVSKEMHAEDRFKEVNEAYQVLKDPKARKAYDQLGPDLQQGQEFRPPPGWHFEFSRGGFDPQQMERGGFSDFLSSIFRDQGAMGDFKAGRREQPLRGSDLHARIRLTLEESYQGSQRILALHSPQPTQPTQPKPQGTSTSKELKINVHIPKGICEGQQIRLQKQGGAGIGGGAKGDLFLEVSFAPHPYFRAEGRTVFLDLPVTPWEAALGTRLKIPTLGGTVLMTIPAGVQSGHKLRLPGRGLPGQPAGDQVVMLRIETPPATTPEATRLYQQMATALPFNPRAYLGS